MMQSLQERPQMPNIPMGADAPKNARFGRPAQQIVEAFPWETAPTYLGRDNEGARRFKDARDVVMHSGRWLSCSVCETSTIRRLK
jgi:hypothetical protein